MYPLVRLIVTSFNALRSGPLPPEQCSEIQFRCRPWDLDLFMEMNNGRILTLYDLGRFDFALRTGLIRTLKKHRWSLAVAGSTIRYRKRVRLFDKVTMRSSVAGFDERWIYIKQSMWVKGEPASSVLLRTGVTSRQGLVSPRVVLDSMQITDWEPLLNEWSASWIESEKLRPWPPQH